MTKKLQIALSQLKLKDGYLDYNRTKILNVMKQIKNKNIDIICFPELVLTGYDFKLINDRNIEVISKEFFAQLAKQYKIAVVAGISIHKSNDIFDSVAIWDKNGDLIHLYNKIHLWGIERENFKAGNELKTIKYNGWNIGFGLCADIGFPEISRILALDEAELIIFPSAWAVPNDPNDKIWELTLRARAAENQLYVAGINRTGQGKITDYCGKSMMIDPCGNIINILELDEGLILSEISKEKVTRRREEIPWLEYRMPETYKAILK